VRGFDIAQAVRKDGQSEEGFVDRVNFYRVGKFRDDHVKAAIEIAVEFVIGRSYLDAVALDGIADFEDRRSHLDMQRLRFRAPRDSAAVIVGQHNDRHMPQLGIEKPLRTDVEIFDVEDGPHSSLYL